MRLYDLFRHFEDKAYLAIDGNSGKSGVNVRSGILGDGASCYSVPGLIVSSHRLQHHFKRGNAFGSSLDSDLSCLLCG